MSWTKLCESDFSKRGPTITRQQPSEDRFLFLAQRSLVRTLDFFISLLHQLSRQIHIKRRASPWEDYKPEIYWMNGKRLGEAVKDGR
jgi:hypothetical protein